MAVYYIRGGPDRIKIGKANDPQKRLNDLQTGNPVVLELLATEPGDRDIECSRHRQFAADRTQGEWFVASPELLRHIDEIKAAKQRPKLQVVSPAVHALPQLVAKNVSLLAWQVQDLFAHLAKAFLGLLVMLVFLGMCVSIFEKPATTQSTSPPATVSTPAEVRSLPVTPTATPPAAPKVKSSRQKRVAPKRLELPCKPGQKPPCYD